MYVKSDFCFFNNKNDNSIVKYNESNFHYVTVGNHNVDSNSVNINNNVEVVNLDIDDNNSNVVKLSDSVEKSVSKSVSSLEKVSNDAPEPTGIEKVFNDIGWFFSNWWDGVKVSTNSKAMIEVSNFVNQKSLSEYQQDGIKVMGEELGKDQTFQLWDQVGLVDNFKVGLSTVGNVFVALFKGLVNLAEKLLDGLTLIGGCILTPFLGIADLVYYAFGMDQHLLYNLWNSEDKGIMQSVKFEMSDSLFDWYYSDYGKEMNDSSLQWFKYKETGYSIGEMVGELIGTIAIGQGLGEATGAVEVIGGAEKTKNLAFIVAGVAGFGEGTEDAWNDGADTGSGLLYGGAHGIFSAFQYWVGGKINTVKIGDTCIGQLVNKISNNSVKTIVEKVSTIALRSLLDGVDGAVEVPFDSGIKTFYNGKTFEETFEEEGGWTSVLIYFFMGAGLSAGSEIVGEVSSSLNVSNTVKKLPNLEGNDLKIIIGDLTDDELKAVLKKSDIHTIEKVLSNVDEKEYKRIIAAMDEAQLRKISVQVGSSESDILLYDSSNVIIENTKVEKLIEWKQKVNDSIYRKRIDNIDFVSDSQEELDRLVNFYNNIKNNANYQNDVFLKKISDEGSLTISNISMDGGSFCSGKMICLDKLDVRTFYHECTHFLDESSLYSMYYKVNKILEDLKKSYSNGEFDKSISEIKNNFDVFSWTDEQSSKYYRRSIVQLRKEIKNFDSLDIDIQSEYILERAIKLRKLDINAMYKGKGYECISDIFSAITHDEGLPFIHRTNYWNSFEYSEYMEVLAEIGSLYNTENKGILYNFFPKDSVDGLIDAYENLVGLSQNKTDIIRDDFDDWLDKLFGS